MSKDKGKKKVIEEDEAEDWCFVCKDGGKLLLCDYKGCGKVYHPGCVELRNSVLKSEGHWTCPRHTCAPCKGLGGPPQFFCLACPSSVCRLCVRAYEFVPVKLNKGLCKSCFEYALLAEENAESDFEGEKLDFQDPDSEDFLFKEYLLIIMEQEELKFTDLRHAHSKKESHNSGSDSDNIVDKDTVFSISDVDSDSDTTDDLSGKRKKSRKERGQKNKIPNLSKAHFANTLELSDSDEKENDSGSCSVNEDEPIISECKSPRTLNQDKVPLEEKVEFADLKRPRTLSPDRVPLEEKVESVVQKSCYASTAVKNIKLVYLRRSLVEELLMQPDNFEEKVVGSFVRVRRMPGNCSGTTFFQLLQVTGIKKTSNAENKGILLEVSCMPVDIPIDMLDDDDISEEECEDLKQRMKDGLLRKPTVMELEQKAKSLHEDITKNWIQRQLVQLQGKIDFAHEKGRKSMLEQCLYQREMLKKSSEQQRLLQKFPSVAAEVIELDATAENSSGSNCST